MKTVAAHDRPREKLQRHGAAALGDNELVAIVIGNGQANRSALDLANRFSKRSAVSKDLRERTTASSRAFQASARRGPRRCMAAVELGRRTLTRAGRHRVQVTTPRTVAELLLPVYGNRPVEQFGVVLLDTKHRVMRTTMVTVGTLDASIVHPREIFREAAAGGAAAIVVFHNHPSGDPEPSTEDIVLTRRLIAAGVLMGIEVLDHVILANVRYCSMKEEGYI